MIYRKLKSGLKKLAIAACLRLESASAWIQQRLLHNTLEELRAQRHMALPPAEMDRSLLGQFIRFVGHSLEKAVRNPYEEGRGRDKYEALKAAVSEWRGRGYPDRNFLAWAEDQLRAFEAWRLSKSPQRTAVRSAETTDNSALLKLMENRGSVRFWSDAPVERSKVERILRAATQAPSSCNRQPWNFYVKFNPAARGGAVECGVSNVSLRHKAPVAIHIAVDERLYPEKYAPAIDAGIAGLQMGLAAEALGLGSCMMYGGENFPQAEVKAELGIPESQYIYLLLLLGYPDERTVTNKRVEVDDAARFSEP